MQLVKGKDPCEGLHLVKSVVLVAASQGSFGEEIHCEQYAQQERQKSQRKFPKKFTPHVSRTSSPRRAPFSGAAGSPDRFQSSPATAARTHPRCAASRTDPCPTRHRATDPA